MGNQVRIGFGAKPYILVAAPGRFNYYGAPTLPKGQGAGSSPDLTHGSPFTVSGSGFGTKSVSVGPLLRDVGTAAVNTIDSQWNGVCEPTTAGGNFNMQLQNYTFQPSSAVIGRPHIYVSKFYAGCHLNLNTGTGGNAVYCGVTFTPPAYPYCVRGSWYFRYNPDWVYDPQSDNNLKDLDWAAGTDYEPGSGNFFYTNWPVAPTPNFWAIDSITKASQAVVHINNGGTPNPFHVNDVLEFNSISGMTQMNGLYGTVQSASGSFNSWSATVNIDSSAFSTYTSGGFVNHPFSNATTAGQCGTDAGGTGMFQTPTDANGHSTAFWNGMLYPMNPSNGWIKREFEMCVTSTTGLGGGGYFRVYDNGVKVMDYAGKTDTIDASARFVGMGNYARDRNANNFRFYTDALVDYSGTGVTGNCACLYFGNASTWDTSTIREPQVADSWSGSSIHIPQFWKGQLSGSVYAHVRTEAGTTVTTGPYTVAASP